MSKRLLSFTATIIVELDILMGTPTVYDVGALIKRGNYTLDASEPLDDTKTLIIRETSHDDER